ncbi:thiamine phosphate synthase [Candidatus Margulisiibacteriota bacterium]
MIRFPDFHIYPVITEKFCRNGSSIETLKELIAAGVKIVQLREKDKSKQDILNLAAIFRTLTSKASVTLIINDHIDIALEVGADGVHLGQDDNPGSTARRQAPGLIIGVSTHNLEEARKAERDGATYINIGPIFATQTKTVGIHPLGVDMIKTISENISIPFTVMGGIKENNIKQLVAAGASRIAMVTEITQARDIGKKFSELRQLFRL